MLDAILRVVERLEADDGKARFVWIDMFSASQNLLAGAYLPRDEAARHALKASDLTTYLACKEDTDRIFDGAIEAVSEILFYFSPMNGQWDAPPHPFLLAERGDTSPPMRKERWMRTGPCALSRAWCLMELSKALANGCTLHLTFNAEDLQNFNWLIETQDTLAITGDHPSLFQEFMATVEVRDAQISKLEDREFVLSVIDRLDGGIGEINERVMQSFRLWALADMRSRISRLPQHMRSLSPITANLTAALLQAASSPQQLEEMLELARSCHAAHKKAHGERARSTRQAAINLLGALVQHGTQRGVSEEVEEAEAIACEVLAIERQMGADAEPRVVCFARLLLCWVLSAQSSMHKAKGEEQLARSKLTEAEMLPRSVLADLQEVATLGDKSWAQSEPGQLVRVFAGYSLAAVLKKGGRLDEAAAELRTTLTFANRYKNLSTNIFSLRTKAFDAVLRHQMNDDITVKAKAQADLEQTCKYIRERLGAGSWWARRMEAQLKEMTTQTAMMA